MLDKYILEFDKIVKTLFTKPLSKREHPDAFESDIDFSETEKREVIGLMRVNHTGEVCAQALYQGQALVARDQTNKEKLEHASFEETEHLAWTSKRLEELGGHTSILNPIFYLGSLAVGAGAGALGDKWSLGFLAETENQVGEHLRSHLLRLPKADIKSKRILEQMTLDEAQHEKMAQDFGAANLPYPVKILMRITSKLMTSTAYHI